MSKSRKKYNFLMKLLYLLVLIISTLYFSSCTPISFSYDALVLSSVVTRVELIYYRQESPQEISDIFGNAYRRHLDFDFVLVDYLETLPKEIHEIFFEEIANLNMQNAVRQRNSPSGFSILIHYETGEFDVFSKLYVGRFSENGQFLEYLGDGLWKESFLAFIEKFFYVEDTLKN